MIAGARYGTAPLRRQGRCALPLAGSALTARANPVFCCQAINAEERSGFYLLEAGGQVVSPDIQFFILSRRTLE